MSHLVDAAMLEIVQESFEVLDDATYWIVTKTESLGDYGTVQGYPESVLEASGLPCHIVKVPENSPARKLVQQKLTTGEVYRLFYPFAQDPMPESEETIILVRSGGDPGAFTVVIGTEDAPESLRNPRRSCLLVRLEGAPEIEVTP